MGWAEPAERMREERY